MHLVNLGEFVRQEKQPIQQHPEGSQACHQNGTASLLSIGFEGYRERRWEGNTLFIHHGAVIPDHSN